MVSPDPNFDGWWSLCNTFGQEGFAASNIFTSQSTLLRNDSYIYIDTTVYPVQITSTYYNDKYPQLQPDFLNPAPIPLPAEDGATNPQQYVIYNNCPHELNSPWNPPLEGPVDMLQSYTTGPTLKLINSNELHAFSYLNNHYTGGDFNPAMSVYRKMCKPPMDTSNLNWNDPLNMFLFMIREYKYQNFSINRHTKQINYIGHKREAKIVKAMMSPEGYTVKVPILAIRVTNTSNYAAVGIGNDTLTTLYTGCPKTQKGRFVPIVPGCTPVISGGTGPLVLLNGNYPNGVGCFNNGGDKTLDSRFVDIGPNGSMRHHFNSFLLTLDTTSLTSLADSNGLIELSSSGNEMVVETTYRISAQSEYPELCAAIRAYYYLVLRSGTHTSFFISYHPPNSSILFDTFAQVRVALANGTANSQPYDLGARLGYPAYNAYYHNFPTFVGFNSLNFINVPWPLTWANSALQYDVAIGNYLVNVQNLLFAIQGTLEEDQPDPAATFGYQPLIPGPNRATFVGLVQAADTTSNPGTITPPATLPTGYQYLGDWGSDYGNANAYYFGQINPILTQGKIIGYLRLTDCLFTDLFGLMNMGIYAPENPNTSINPRISRESVSAVYSVMMLWFKSIHCESIVIDWTFNQGGSNSTPLALTEFFGTSRLIYKEYVVPKTTNEPLLSQSDLCLTSTVENAFREEIAAGQIAFPKLNEQLYPGSTYTGEKDKPFYLILLTDYSSYSFGDVCPSFFTGECNNGNLGQHTYCRILGCVEGREWGFIVPNINVPYNTNPQYSANNFYDENANPTVPFLYVRDAGSGLLAYTKKQVSGIRQHNGILPLPCPVKGTTAKPLSCRNHNNAMPFSGETLVFPDFGYNSPIRPALEGWTLLHAFPPNSSDPSTWQFTYLEGAISTLLDPKKYFFSRKFKSLKRSDASLN